VIQNNESEMFHLTFEQITEDALLSAMETAGKGALDKELDIEKKGL
jgi:hypothetical protein